MTQFSLCSEGNILAVEMKDLCTRYTTDVIATTAFGIECDSLSNPKNEFYEMGKDVANFGGVRALILFGYAISPKLMKVRMQFLYPQYHLNAVKYLLIYTMFLLSEFRDRSSSSHSATCQTI
jgi:hypothetical protein